MDYIFINTDFYLETDIDYASLNLTSSKIVVPRMVVEELEKEKSEKSNKILKAFEEYKKLKYFIFDNETNPQNVDILDFVFEFHCDKKFFASFSMGLLSKNTFDLFFECKEFAQKEVVSDSVAKKFVPIIEKAAKEDNDVAKNILGLCYSSGYGLEQNHELAIEWFKKARKANIDIGIRELYVEKLRQEREQIIKRNKTYKLLGAILFIVGMICVFALLKIEHLFGSPSYLYLVILVLSGVIALVGEFVFVTHRRRPIKVDRLEKEIDNLKSVDRYRRAAAEGDKKAQERLKAMEKKKSIDDIVHELNADKISDEHSRAKRWYKTCLVVMCILLLAFGYYMCWNVTDETNNIPVYRIIFRILFSMSFLSLLFILMNQAARSRKNMVLLSKEIQEYKYIGALLKGKVDMSTDGEETNKEINQALNQMIQLHLDIQKQRLEKEDHSEVKDITPDVLNFFKDNTSTMMGNFNEMQKNILDLHKTIVQTLKGKGDGK